MVRTAVIAALAIVGTQALSIDELPQGESHELFRSRRRNPNTSSTTSSSVSGSKRRRVRSSYNKYKNKAKNTYRRKSRGVRNSYNRNSRRARSTYNRKRREEEERSRLSSIRSERTDLF